MRKEYAVEKAHSTADSTAAKNWNGKIRKSQAIHE